MPMPDRDPCLIAQLVQTEELVVDEGFQRTDIETADGGRRPLPEFADDGEKGGFRLAGGGGGGEEEVVIGVEDHVGRGDLHGP